MKLKLCVGFKLTDYFTTGFQEYVQLQGQYFVIANWGSHCNLENGEGCDKSAPGAFSRGDGQFDLPEGVCIDSKGFVYVVEQGNNQIQKFLTEEWEFRYKKWGSKGNDDGQFITAFAIAIDSHDKIYVSDDGGRVQKFDTDGKFITKWGTYGTQVEQFNSPHGMCVDFFDDIYVSDEMNSCIQKFDNNGKFITRWGTFVLNLDSKQNCNSKAPGAAELGDGQFNHPMCIASDSDNNIYVADQLNHRIRSLIEMVTSLLSGVLVEARTHNLTDPTA